MKEMIDCFLIGHNEIEFEDYEKTCKEMGRNSGIFRDLNLNYLRYNNKPYSATGMYNLLGLETDSKASPAISPLKSGETFSAAIAYLGSFLHQHGLHFDFVNSFQDQAEELTDKLRQCNIITIGIITTLYVSVLPILEIIRFIKQHNTMARIIVGGPFISTQVRILDEKTLVYLFQNIGADFYIDSSQGEATLVNIIHSIKNGISPHTIDNIYYRCGDQYIATSKSREDNRLSDNPVNWPLFTGRIPPFVNIRTAISCPFSCSFCGFPQHAGKYQAAPVDFIEYELDQLVNTRPIKSIYFIDDTFNVPPARFKEILRMIIKKKYTFNWHSYFRCQFADQETIELMKESHCQGVFLGIESGNEQILENMNKAVHLEKYRQGIKLLKKYKITTFGSFITGFPGETEQTIHDTIAFIEESGLDFFRTQLWYGEPITPIWKEKEKYQIQGQSFEWSHATMDSRTACDWIDHLFLSIKNSTWIPQYNFDYDSVWHIVHRGHTLEQVKRFIQAFNQGVKEKLTRPDHQEVSYEVIKQMQEAFLNNPGDQECPGIINEPDHISSKYDADFEY